RHTRCYRDWSSDVCSSDLPVEKSAIAPTAIALTSIAIALVFSFHPFLAHELYVFNRHVTGHSHPVNHVCQKVRVIRQPKKDEDWWKSGRVSTTQLLPRESRLYSSQLA